MLTSAANAYVPFLLEGRAPAQCPKALDIAPPGCPRTPGPSDTEQVPDGQVAPGAGISALFVASSRLRPEWLVPTTRGGEMRPSVKRRQTLGPDFIPAALMAQIAGNGGAKGELYDLRPGSMT
jgi:hypothetical protein